MSRFILPIFVVLVMVSPSQGKPKPPTYNVNFQVGWGACYRPMEWTPLEISILRLL